MWRIINDIARLLPTNGVDYIMNDIYDLGEGSGPDEPDRTWMTMDTNAELYQTCPAQSAYRTWYLAWHPSIWQRDSMWEVAFHIECRISCGMPHVIWNTAFCRECRMSYGMPSFMWNAACPGERHVLHGLPPVICGIPHVTGNTKRFTGALGGGSPGHLSNRFGIFGPVRLRAFRLQRRPSSNI